MNRDISNMDDIIDVRDIIARVEELEEAGDSDHRDELEGLTGLLADLNGYGGDEHVTLIRDSHFQDYAQELAEDCGMINSDATWPNNCIDWERAARELRYDYSSVEFDGVTYWYR